MGSWHGPASERFFRKYSPEPNTGCWLWTASVDIGGQPRFNDCQGGQLAARFAYEMQHGKLDKHSRLRKLCETDICVNPYHFKSLPLGYRSNNRELRMSHIKEYRKKFRDLLAFYKNKPCADCGNQYPSYCMDFDHVDPSTKKYAIADMRWGLRKQLAEEVRKCEVVCANCHRIRTHKRLAS